MCIWLNRLKSGISPRSDDPELLLHRFADFESFDEVGDYFMIDTCSCTCESLESLVRVRVVLAAEDGLDSLCNHSPIPFKVGTQGVFVEDQFAQTLLQ